MNIHFPEQSYSCTICDAKFNQQDSLKVHLRLHIPDTPVPCDVCHKNFASLSNLKVHKIRQHPETLNLPIQDENEPGTPDNRTSEKETNSITQSNENLPNRDVDQPKWTDQADLSNFSILAGKNKKLDNLSDFYIIERQFDLNSMMSDLFPDDDK